MPENGKDDKEQKVSYLYEKLSQESKDKVDAILSFLQGMNTKEASRLLNTAEEELSYRSVVLT